MATAVSPKVFRNFINGEWVEAKGGKTFENRNPANTDDVVGVFPAAAREDVEAAVDAARQAFVSWRQVPAPKRAEILFRAAERLVERKDELAREMTREMGKVVAETMGDVQEAIDRIGRDRVIRSRCESEACLEIGQKLGVTMYQGHYFDSLLRARASGGATAVPAAPGTTQRAAS